MSGSKEGSPYKFDRPLAIATMWTGNKNKREIKLRDSFYFKYKGLVHQIVAGKEFKSDGGSIPRWFWRIITPFDPRALAAFVVHDYICEHGEEIGISRKEGDEMLKKILKLNGFKYLSWLIYKFVRTYAIVMRKDK